MNNTSMVYVLVEDWAYDGDAGASILGVFDDEELAEKRYNQAIERLKENDNVYDHISKGDRSYETFVDGEYNNFHERLWIEPMILNDSAWLEGNVV